MNQTSLEMDVDIKQNVKHIVNSAKYLKKCIRKLKEEGLSECDKKRIFNQFEELVEVIVDCCRENHIEC